MSSEEEEHIGIHQAGQIKVKKGNKEGMMEKDPLNTSEPEAMLTISQVKQHKYPSYQEARQKMPMIQNSFIQVS